MQQLNPITVPLQEGRYLIQASAGTGKTWTISLLYLRLLIELSDSLELTVDRILVVTYTRAATDELRERILQRLRIAVRVYENPDSATSENTDQEYLDLLTQYPPNKDIILILKRALLNFDEAAVYTIHGFCQRALKENAFDVSMPFESEMISDEESLLLALSDQFWHRNLLKPNGIYADLLKRQSFTPDTLLNAVRSFIGKPYLSIKRPPEISDETFQHYAQQFDACCEQVAQIWQSEKETIVELINKADLKKTSYKPEHLEACYNHLDKLSTNSFKPEWLKTFIKLTPEYLTAKGVKKGKEAPQHALFNAIEQLLISHNALAAQQKGVYDQLLYELLIWLREQLPQAKLRSGLMAFDDLLVNLQEALKRRDSLAGQLANDYKVALIDEFQDTDPVQYEVFDRIYAEQGVLFYVGDPKQAIYSFRGADINTYLAAAKDVDEQQRYTLNRNFRSDPALIQAFNVVFAASQDPFRNDNSVTYEQVSAGKSGIEPIQAEYIKAPFRFWDWQGDEEKDKVSSSALQADIADSVATEIAQLLSDGQQGKAAVNGKPIESSDIAILVRSHKQGGLIKQALQRHGIVSVQKSPVGIFATHEAVELRFLLDAIIEPSNERKLRRAIVGDLLGGNSETLMQLDQDPSYLEQLIEHFHTWRQSWQKHGFMAMFRQWLNSTALTQQEQSCYAYILSFVDGERRLTNLLHLAELIHGEIRREALGMQSVLRWLTSCRKQSVVSSEENQLRLESDDDLVQIVTIHKSKGLQYPIVYCPFLWADGASRQSSDWFTWHDAEQNQSCLQACDDGRETALQIRQAEENSESLRLLYVALTRAEFHCTVVIPTGAINTFGYNTALYWLLYGHLDNATQLMQSASKRGKMKPEAHQSALEQQLLAFVEQAPNAIQHQLLIKGDESVYYQPIREQQTPRIYHFEHHVPRMSRIGSFSGLTRGTHDELPDYDALVLQPQARRSLDFYEFPAGAKAGVCLHKMYECLQFDEDLETQRELIIERTLLQYGYELNYLPAAMRLLEQSLQTPLNETGLCLAQLSQVQRLDEMEFYFPVNQLNVDVVKQVLHDFMPLEWNVIHQAIEQLSFSRLQGYMKGFIDLVFEHEGLYYIVDYKSNRLAETPTEYTFSRMQQAVAESHYYLQYLIYAVALHRYLSLRIPDYTWDTHIGGIYYLFIRGMTFENEGQTGVYSHLPEAALIESLDALMQ